MALPDVSARHLTGQVRRNAIGTARASCRRAAMWLDLIASMCRHCEVRSPLQQRLFLLFGEARRVSHCAQKKSPKERIASLCFETTCHKIGRRTKVPSVTSHNFWRAKVLFPWIATYGTATNGRALAGVRSKSNPASRSLNIVVPDASVTSWKTRRPANDTPCTFRYSAFGDFLIRLADSGCWNCVLAPHFHTTSKSEAS
jgi:hypothetical protein